MSITSACSWQRARGITPDRGTATSSHLREQGIEYRYQSAYIRAKFAIAQWAEERAGRPPQPDGPRLQICVPDGRFPQNLIRLASSFPILKTAWGITSHRGNAPGPNGHTFYPWLQSPGADRTLCNFRRKIRRGTYRPGGFRREYIPKGDGTNRVLHIGNIEDRLVERAIVLVLVPIYEFLFSRGSFGFRPGLSVAHALSELNRICIKEGRFVLGKLDISDAFGHVLHDRLLDILAIWVKSTDPDLFNLIEKFVRRKGWKNRDGNPHMGLAQGGPLSPLLFNILLDHVMDKYLELAGVRFIRWADDILLVCRDRRELENNRHLVDELLQTAGMKINGKKDRSADLRNGETIEYLGYEVGRGNGELRYGLTVDALGSLICQLRLDVTKQYPNVGADGYRRFLENTAKWNVGGWLEAYAGAIPSDMWNEIRDGISPYVIGKLPRNLGTQSGPRLHPTILELLPTSTLDHLYARARGRWESRYGKDIPDVHSRLMLQRDAHAIGKDRRVEPAHIADGADLVPAPSAVVMAGPRAGPNDVDDRVKLLPA